MALQELNSTLFRALMIAGTLGLATQAQALDIDASTLAADGWVLNGNYWTTDQNSTLSTGEVAAMVGAGPLGEAYKQDYDMSPPDEGSAAAYYSTVFSGDDPNNATISWDAGAQYYIACPSCYLVVKDGSADPSQYLFDISGWNGQAPLNLTNFWPGPGGAISFVAIYNNAAPGGGGGGTITPIPEAETYAMMLAGLGLVGWAARRRRG